MGYRFLKIQTDEQRYLRTFLALHPEYKTLSYDELFDVYIRDGCGWQLNYPTYLAKLGNEADKICINFEFLQKQWAKENGVKYDRKDWLKQIVAAQLKAFKPDVLLLDDLYVVDADFRRFLRESCPNPVKIIGWRAAPTVDYSVFRDVDLMLTCTPLFARQMRDHGVNAELMMHAFEPSILQMTSDSEARDIDFSFVGGIFLKTGFHNERWSLLKRMLSTTNLEIWGNVIEEQQTPGIADKLQWRVGQAFDRVGLDAMASKLPSRRRQSGVEATSVMRDYGERLHEQVVALEYFKILARSKLNLNKHIDCAEEFAGNVRLFEATGMGACLITDWKINLPEMFEPDTEIVAYRTPEECAEKVRYLLDHESERRAIAAAGQRRTLQDHTYEKRSEQLDSIVKLLLSGNRMKPNTHVLVSA